LATVVTDLDLAVGELVQMSVKEMSKGQVLLQLVGREGVFLGTQMAAEPQLARLVASNRLPVDRPHLNAIRKLLARGLPITREAVERLARSEQAGLAAGLETESTDTVLARLLESYDLSPVGPRLYAARQLLARGLPLTRENVEQLTRTLAGLGSTTEEDFQAATYLQANGLPLSRAALEVTRASLVNPAPLGSQLHQLRQALAWVTELWEALTAERGFPGEGLHRVIGEVMRQLSRRVLQTEGEDRAVVADRLRCLVKDQGTSLEHRLDMVLSGRLEPADLEGDLRLLLTRLAQAVPPDGSATEDVPEKGLAAGAAGVPEGATAAIPDNPDLRRVLAHVRRIVPDLVDTLQLQQLKNVSRPADRSEPWLAFQLPLSGPAGEPTRTAELRIGRRSGRKSGARGFRLLLRLDLPRLERVEVRVDLIGKQLGCRFAGSSASLPVLQGGFDALRQGLEGMGYTVGTPSFKPLTPEPDPMEVTAEVPQRLVRIDVRV
jgi:hypothetical protein